MNLKEAINYLGNVTDEKIIRIISYPEVDSIISSAILSRLFQRQGKKFSVRFAERMDEKIFEGGSENVFVFPELKTNEAGIMNSCKHDAVVLKLGQETTFPANVLVAYGGISYSNVPSGVLSYLFSFEISSQNKDLARIAIVSLAGTEFDKTNSNYNKVIVDSEAMVKRGLLVHPATRPIDRALESSTSLYIPKVTGSLRGAIELLNGAGIKKDKWGYKSSIDLTEDELGRLLDQLSLRGIDSSNLRKLVGDIYLLKTVENIEDTREIRAVMASCISVGAPEIALGVCLKNNSLRKQAEKINAEYKMGLFSAFEHLSGSEVIEGNGYLIVDLDNKAREDLVDVVIGLLASSPFYSNENFLVALVNKGSKAKFIAKSGGKRDAKELLNTASISLAEELKGNKNNAECIVAKDARDTVIDNLKNLLEVELLKV